MRSEVRTVKENLGAARSSRGFGAWAGRRQGQADASRKGGKTVLLASGAVIAALLGGYAIASLGGDPEPAQVSSTEPAPTDPEPVVSAPEPEPDPVPSAPSAPASPAPPTLEQTYTNYFIAYVPKGWYRDTIDEENATDGGDIRITNIWRDPNDSDTSILIDTSPAPGIPVMDSAASVREGTSQLDGYQEIAFREIFLGGRTTAEWIFDLPEDRRVDYFFEECGQGFAVLGVAPRDRFDSLAPTYKRVAASVSSYCD